MRARCFACDRQLGKTPQLVTCADEQDVFIGAECAKHVAHAGAEGWQPPKGGPRLYLLAHDPKGKPTFHEIGARLDRARATRV